MSLYDFKREAKIECVVARPFYYGMKKYLTGDIFFFNPATPRNSQQHRFYKNGRFYQLEEDKYKYVLVAHAPKTYNGITYKNGDVVDLSFMEERQRFLQVVRGWMKKVIIDSQVIEPKKEEMATETEQQTEPQEFQMPVFEESSNLSKLTKQVGEHFNKSAKGIKTLAEEKLDIKLGSYTQKLTEEQFNKILELLNSEKESGE